MKQKRARMTSLAERMQTLGLHRIKDGPFTTLQAQGASFEWQQPKQFYVEAGDLMVNSTAFATGSDGAKCWWLDGDATNLLVSPIDKIQQLNLSVCDPFDLMHETPAQAASARDLEYIGEAQFGGIKCHLLQGWGWDNVAPDTLTPIGFLTQWWIDDRTGRPLANQLYWENMTQKTRYFYDTVNRSLQTADFSVPKINGLSSAPGEILVAGYTNCIMNVDDGCDGNMRINYISKGPKGENRDGYVDFN